MMRRIVGMVLIAAVSLVWGGCQASSGGAGNASGVKVEIAPDLSPYQIHKVAILDFVNQTGDPDANQLADDVTRALFQSGKYQFTTRSSFSDDAKRVGEEKDYKRCLETWRKRRVMDEEPLSRLLQATGKDAVIAMECNKWSEEKLSPTQEGTSNSSVGLKVALFASDGTLLWSGSQLKVEKSVPYFPDFNTRATTTGEARTTSARAVPDPPAIEKVAVKAAEEVVAKLPVIRRETDKNPGASSKP